MLKKINLTINWLEARLPSCAWILVANTHKQWTVSELMMRQSTVYRETQQCLKSCRNLRGNRRSSRLCFRGCVGGSIHHPVWFGVLRTSNCMFWFSLCRKLMFNSAGWMLAPNVNDDTVCVYMMLRREVFFTLQKQPTMVKRLYWKIVVTLCWLSNAFLLFQVHFYWIHNIVICFRLKRRFLKWLRVISWLRASQERKKTAALQDS